MKRGKIIFIGFVDKTQYITPQSYLEGNNNICMLIAYEAFDRYHVNWTTYKIDIKSSEPPKQISCEVNHLKTCQITTLFRPKDGVPGMW